eukprot:Selendium_serpulae@DN5679_c0_g1_i6.p1
MGGLGTIPPDSQSLPTPSINRFFFDLESNYFLDPKDGIYFDPATRYYMSRDGQYFMHDIQQAKLVRVFQLGVSSSASNPGGIGVTNIKSGSSVSTSGGGGPGVKIEGGVKIEIDEEAKERKKEAVASILAAAQMTAAASKQAMKAMPQNSTNEESGDAATAAAVASGGGGGGTQASSTGSPPKKNSSGPNKDDALTKLGFNGSGVGGSGLLGSAPGHLPSMLMKAIGDDDDDDDEDDDGLGGSFSGAGGTSGSSSVANHGLAKTVKCRTHAGTVTTAARPGAVLAFRNETTAGGNAAQSRPETRAYLFLVYTKVRAC